MCSLELLDCCGKQNLFDDNMHGAAQILILEK